jgi:alpha-1,3/alpha-1,6-mannosyltransferase
MGIGGSERLVTDAAVALNARGHAVTIYVPDREEVAQFPALADHEIPFDTTGASLPSHLAGRLRAPMAIARTAYAGWQMSQRHDAPQVIFSDVVPHVIPLVKRWTRAPILYYCHFPDLLLTREGSRDSAVYRAYRRPLDRIEERGVAAADVVVTNSHFTAGIVRASLPSVAPERIRVLYPGVSVPAAPMARPADESDLVMLSVGRFDPRKNLNLAVEALLALRARIPPALFSRVRLVLAGYHDRRLPEAVALVDQLQARVEAKNLGAHVRFAFSPDEQGRQALVARCRLVVYTPTAEHFGYVPVEAMAAGRPVVAVNAAGPAETVRHGVTGWLCDPTPEAFADAAARLLSDQDAADNMGRAGHAHVTQHFSLDAFGDSLHALVEGLASPTTMPASR